MSEKNVTDSGALAVVNEERSIADVKNQVEKIQELMKSVMKDGEHFGIIPGTGSKPSLYKPGAEKLCFVFRLAPEYEIERDDFPNLHREYRVRCRLRNMASGSIVGEGVGSCSTMESKYRYRNVSDYDVTESPIPKDAKEKKADYRKQGFGMKKIDGEWKWVRYKSEGKVENPDIADTYNTVLKMAKKRAHVDATITACAASDIFTQDVEEMVPEEDSRHEEPPNTSKEPTFREKTLAEMKGVFDANGFTEAEIAFYRADVKDCGEDEKKLADLLEDVKKCAEAKKTAKPMTAEDDAAADKGFEGAPLETGKKVPAETVPLF